MSQNLHLIIQATHARSIVALIETLPQQQPFSRIYNELYCLLDDIAGQLLTESNLTTAQKKQLCGCEIVTGKL